MLDSFVFIHHYLSLFIFIYPYAFIIIYHYLFLLFIICCYFSVFIFIYPYCYFILTNPGLSYLYLWHCNRSRARWHVCIRSHAWLDFLSRHPRKKYLSSFILIVTLCWYHYIYWFCFLWFKGISCKNQGSLSKSDTTLRTYYIVLKYSKTSVTVTLIFSSA